MKKLLHNSKIYKFGFTLAEVLITLVIVGVVAAFTIPTLVNNTKKQEYVAGLKKANSVLSQAVYKIGQNKGYPVGDYSFFNDVDFIDEFAKVVNVNKKCSNMIDCFGRHFSGYKWLNGAGVSAMTENNSVVTSDGQMFTHVRNFGLSFGLSGEDTSNALGRIVVDINGQKNPNQFGYDTFLFYIVDKKGIVPAGANSTSDCIANGSGQTCAAKVLKENAMNY